MSPRLIDSIWGRVVQYAGPETNWVTAHAIRQNGDGPFIADSATKVKVFYRLADLIEWAKVNGVSHLEF